MVLYFSGTGNSQLVAITIAEHMGDEVVSINQLLKRGEVGPLRSEQPLVFVAPTYSWRLPRVVEQWILNSDFSGSRDAYFILTCGGSCGNAAAYAEKLCTKKGLRFRGLAPVLMPENYIALFKTPSREECAEIVARATPRVVALAEQIQSGQSLSGPPVSLMGRLESGPINPLFYAVYVKDKGFTVSAQCISCGKCAQRCPLNNIELVDGRPRWNGTCTHCMACIGGCPAEAIEYKSNSKGQHRHNIMDDTWERGGRAH